MCSLPLHSSVLTKNIAPTESHGGGGGGGGGEGGDLKGAGDGPEAIYARGNLEALRGNYAEARRYFEQAARLKVADAPAALAQLDELESY